MQSCVNPETIWPIRLIGVVFYPPLNLHQYINEIFNDYTYSLATHINDQAFRLLPFLNRPAAHSIYFRQPPVYRYLEDLHTFALF